MTDTIMGYDERLQNLETGSRACLLTRGAASFRVFVHMKSITLENSKTNLAPYSASAVGLVP